MFAHPQQLFYFISNFRQVINFVAMSHNIKFFSPQIQNNPTGKRLYIVMIIATPAENRK